MVKTDNFYRDPRVKPGDDKKQSKDDTKQPEDDKKWSSWGMTKKQPEDDIVGNSRIPTRCLDL